MFGLDNIIDLGVRVPCALVRGVKVFLIVTQPDERVERYACQVESTGEVDGTQQTITRDFVFDSSEKYFRELRKAKVELQATWNVVDRIDGKPKDTD